jgi:hypothetical protein
MTIIRQTNYHAPRIVLALLLGVVLVAMEAAAQLYFYAEKSLRSLTKQRGYRTAHLRHVSYLRKGEAQAQLKL